MAHSVGHRQEMHHHHHHSGSVGSHPNSRINGPQQQAPYSGNTSSAGRLDTGRHLPPLSQPSYPQHPNTLPPLSPFSHRPYPSAPSFPPPLARPQHHQQQQPQPSQSQSQPQQHYSNHWDQRNDHSHSHPPPPPTSQPTSRLHRSDSTSSSHQPPPTSAPPVHPDRSVSQQSDPPPSAAPPRDTEDGMPPASDFVKKLFKMLDDSSFSHVVCWGPQGDCFVVKDMTEFTKAILPRMFKHSNFASFVRQLNKYDFHKIKNSDDSTFGDQSWTFKHPDFRQDNREALENIKRKVPAQRKGARGSNVAAASSTTNNPGSPVDASVSTPVLADSTPLIANLQAQIDRLTRSHDDVTQQLRSLEGSYQNVVQELVQFQRGMASQDAITQQLISYFIQLETGKAPISDKLSMASFASGRSAFDQMGGTPMSGLSFSGSASSVDSNATLVSSLNGSSPPEMSPTERSALSRQESFARLEELRRARFGAGNGANSTSAGGESSSSGGNESGSNNVPFVTALNPASSLAARQQAQQQQHAQQAHQQHQQQQQQAHQQQQQAQQAEYDRQNLEAAEASSREWTYGRQQDEGPSGSGSSNEMLENSNNEPTYHTQNPSAGLPPPMDTGVRIRRQGVPTIVPGWAVPPRVLLVDDDLVSRKLFSRFLQVGGCTIDVAVDGIGAVNKMNLEKYDLVLMDIVMPKLDGVSATSLIRQFDHMTPIISMTSNSKPNEVLTYISSGMNDILPKPFTKENLFTMLEKHLDHLKQQMSKPQIEIVTSDPSSSKPLLSGMMEDQYSTMMLHNLLGGGSGVPDGFVDGVVIGDGMGNSLKRGLEEVDDDGSMKRGRFEVVE